MDGSVGDVITPKPQICIWKHRLKLKPVQGMTRWVGLGHQITKTVFFRIPL